MPISVTALSITPVKGTRLHEVDTIELGRTGVRDNRRFYIVDRRRHLINGKRLGELQRGRCRILGRRELKLTFPDGTAVEDDVRLGEEVETQVLLGQRQRTVAAGPVFAMRFSDYAGQPLGSSQRGRPRSTAGRWASPR